MKIFHKILNYNERKIPYIYVEMVDNFEFSDDFLHSTNKNSFLNQFKTYAKNNINTLDENAFVIINGVLIGQIDLKEILRINKGS